MKNFHTIFSNDVCAFQEKRKVFFEQPSSAPVESLSQPEVTEKLNEELYRLFPLEVEREAFKEALRENDYKVQIGNKEYTLSYEEENPEENIRTTHLVIKGPELGTYQISRTENVDPNNPRNNGSERLQYFVYSTDPNSRGVADMEMRLDYTRNQYDMESNGLTPDQNLQTFETKLGTVRKVLLAVKTNPERQQQG